VRTQLNDFMQFHVGPANREWHREVSAGRYPIALIERLK
jgi:acyl-CoA dehydrogenase